MITIKTLFKTQLLELIIIPKTLCKKQLYEVTTTAHTIFETLPITIEATICIWKQQKCLDTCAVLRNLKCSCSGPSIVFKYCDVVIYDVVCFSLIRLEQRKGEVRCIMGWRVFWVTTCRPYHFASSMQYQVNFSVLQ